MYAIEVNDLTKKYGDYTAVDGISFHVNQGDLFAFLGENGAGKTTTIQMLVTLLKKTSGTAKLLGYELEKQDKDIRSSIGIVFQNSVLDNKLSVKENLETRASYYGYSKKEIRERIEKFWEPFELEAIWKQKYETLSGGQRRRVDIVRALLHNPKILFLDEPTTGLDPASRKMVWDYIHYLRREEGLTIFLTTHYMEETADANHVVILDKGHIIAEGTPAELKSRYTKKRFLWYTEEKKEYMEILSDYEFVYEKDHYVVSFEDNIMPLLSEHQDKIKDFEIWKGTMDDVFLNLTGKEFAK